MTGWSGGAGARADDADDPDDADDADDPDDADGEADANALRMAEVRRNGTSAPPRVHDDTWVPVPAPGQTTSDGPCATTAANRNGSVEASSSAYSAPLPTPITPTLSPDTSGRSASHRAAVSPYSTGMRLSVSGRPGRPK